MGTTRATRARKTDLFIAALNLRQKDREKLALMLLDSLDDQEVSEAEAAKAWEKEILRRAEELRTGKVKGIPVERVRRDIDALLKGIRRKRR